jgi:putative nucleotidyltransferase with HDIG domain
MMTMDSIPKKPVAVPAEETRRKLSVCRRLPSLHSVNTALVQVMMDDNIDTIHIADIIRKDPSLSARMLRLANSAYFGHSLSITSIEEAVFFLGIRQIRQLSMTTPIIEESLNMTHTTKFPWRGFWQHCIAVAIMTRDICSRVMALSNDETEYLAGLLHDLGKIAIATNYPEHFNVIYGQEANHEIHFLDLEKSLLGMDHAEIGSVYLKAHKLPKPLVDVALNHHHPSNSESYPELNAAVNLADEIVRSIGLGYSGNPTKFSRSSWKLSKSWFMLFRDENDPHYLETIQHLEGQLEELPHLVDQLV